MQMIVDSLRKKGKIYKKMQEISPKDLGVRNRMKIYKATDVSGYFWAIFAISQKSKLLMKDVHKFEEIYVKLSLFCAHNFKHKIIFIDAPLCIKAKEAFILQGWKIQ
ncbi:MAG: hypothetical protein A2513_02405 [Sulfurimonas sp. RIFOXYD12_FULL_33_39]|uniref:hypothetical protein n=1 Tax=unclassified Sulfurimonas TaxID=2623549 RepID=UPI0008B2E500|nr:MULTISPECIES: hypothetical protein [unclassified Sulfurimonas]OHE07375.1 MAG: hypothetical protein A3G74_07115 [Sulfurimonas sp. RIFCSPLOWO2_12_FULL_34_6]OHE08856.1 MAG: hypothetical protein A2513_02405 [Sulfurimonas sp. RIFOXYD12_FULL_33_39]OHE14166.1 MAG: hypothetical protein A2530_05705 [Sulfurimonas sp. RIFOXYD2_FULL_34_21]